MKKIVIYYSLEGNTKYVAEKIAQYAGADLLEIQPVKAYRSKGFMKYVHGVGNTFTGKMPALKAYEFDGSLYDEAIICTPTWASNFVPPIRTFVNENRQALKGMDISVYAGYRGNGADECIEKLRQFIGVDQIKSNLFLIDPADKQDADKDEAIRQFSAELMED